MKPGMRSTINKIANQIRLKGVLDKADFVILCDLSPSTFYNYKDIIERIHPDIKFMDGVYRHIEVEQVEKI